MTIRLILRAVAGALLVGGGLAACAGDTAAPSAFAPSLSASEAAPVLKRGNGKALGNVRGYSGTLCTTHNTQTGSGVFGPAGGTLLFGTSRLIIPGGALTDTVTISATIPGGDNSRVVFAPHGLQFAKSAGLLLDTSGCSIDPNAVPDVVYLSEEGDVLEFLPAVYDPHWHTFATPIDHFSGYAIAF